ncbi:double-strand break repair protein AddB [Jannaschia sp. W003]|uniref:double-strand break repair protein AddB n=1 Tax=Jannaschia sp. W003 TaxID=2867012 RepID=UPI0021A42BC7|nr:double-strand break repair protein AddB [Jannaschia sp. W003]UWQ21616.1 double-strand break repair protein AddB [Jannaschia sp. W003]
MNVFHEPLGVDFTAAFVDGLRARLHGEPPEAMAGVTLLLPTRRMQRRLAEMMLRGGAAVLPRIALVSDLGPLVPHLALPPERSALSLRLELARLVDALLEEMPHLAPRAAAFDLAGSLGDLLAEMKEEGVGAAALGAVDLHPLPEHWQNSVRFLRIAVDFAERADLGAAADVQALCLDALEAAWAAAPPPGRVIVAGSTGSRAQTARLMRMVAALPNGAVVLPGLDREMPVDAWDALDPATQDHPQFRHRAFLGALGLANSDVPQWSDHRPAAPERTRLLSLALRPPPVTHAWLAEGPPLAAEAEAACAGLTLVEAATPIEEAEVIALRLRQAVEEGTRAALISPDRTLSRQVAAVLDRWGLEPDDSAGRPLDLSPPGRLLIQTARLRGRAAEAETLVALLKHPLAHSNGARREHLKRTRDMEMGWLRGGPLHPDPLGLRHWAQDERTRGVDDAWTAWLSDLLVLLEREQTRRGTLLEHASEHLALMNRIGAGSALPPGDPFERPTGALWDEAAGREALAAMQELIRDAEAAGPLEFTADDYARFLAGLLAARDVREPDRPHPDVMIWGALEARVQGADLVILGGLNDGTWPSLPGPDMWMSRGMRAACGLRAPERTVGLSAHDFEQAAAGRTVWLTRALRSAETQTVPSRWLNRMTSLLGGIGPEGEAALAGMRARGAEALGLARALRAPCPRRHHAPPARRPAPVPPRAARPRKLSVTAVERLIRDPYAIYARDVLRLRLLAPLRPPSDAALRGEVVHDVLASFGDAAAVEADALLEALRTEMEYAVPGAATRALWLGRFARIAPDFAAQEAARRGLGRPAVIEGMGEWRVPGTDFTLTARADRIDDRGTAVAIFDYKTGTVPTEKQQAFFAKQLLLEALMVEGGAFADLGPRPVEEVAFLGVGTMLATRGTRIDDEIRAELLEGLRALIARYGGDAPFPARLAPDMVGYAGDYDHLARHGEWTDAHPFEPEPVDP